MKTAEKLRELASWYREFAERAGNPSIWDSRLRTADDLDNEAERIERRSLMDEADRHFGLVVEAAPNAMVMVDPAGEIVMVNARPPQDRPADARQRPAGSAEAAVQTDHR
jgi:PAS domain-containing protein